MHTDTSTLNDLVAVLEDGRKFYREASEEVKRPDLKQLFDRMARTKTAIANDLKNKVVASGEEPTDGGSLGGSLRQFYGETKAKLAGDSDAEYVAQLEEFEDRILAAFRDATAESDDPGVRSIAQKYMPEVTRDHNEMRGLKQALKH